MTKYREPPRQPICRRHDARRPRLVVPLVFLVALLLSACTGPQPSVHFYVDPVLGNDANAGTAAEPYGTLTHALSVASAGHVVHLAGGTYDSVSGEVWPTHFGGFPPTANPNVPDGVTITADGNVVRLAGPVGYDTQTALVFEGEAQVSGVNVSGFEFGVLVGAEAKVVLDDVHVTGSGEIGVLVRGDAELTIRNSTVNQNDAIGLAAFENAVVVIAGAEFAENSPGVEVADTASVEITGSDLHHNGSGIPGGENGGISVFDQARLSVDDTALRENAYAGLHMRGAFDVTVGPDTVISGNFIGVVADAFEGGAASIAFDGATVRDNEYEGIFWAIPLGASFTMRDTSVIDNGDNGLYFFGDAVTIDLGTPAEPGGNDFSGNGEPLILDARPGRAAPDGTIISVSQSDIMPGCPVVAGPKVGPVDLDCNGVTVVSVLNLNNRVEVVADQ